MGPKVIDSVDLCRLLGALAFLGITKRALKKSVTSSSQTVAISFFHTDHWGVGLDWDRYKIYAKAMRNGCHNPISVRR